MEHQWQRTEMMIGPEGIKALRGAYIAVFGIGGVGGFAVEALVRAGIGAVDLFDSDKVSLTNINRQIIATHDTIGMTKVAAMGRRIGAIDPSVRVGEFPVFYLPENADEYDLTKYDYVIDAVDTVSAKIELAVRCTQLKVPIISAMGAGNKMDPEKLRVTDLSKTSMCPLARVMRRELKKRGIEHLKVVYSEEKTHKPLWVPEEMKGERIPPASISFVPSTAGLLLAGAVVRDLIFWEE